MSTLTKKQTELRDAAEADFSVFCRLVAPNHLFGDVHFEAMGWLEGLERAIDDQSFVMCRNYLLLLARGHLKSFIAAMFVCWLVAKRPTITISYTTPDLDLGKLQMGLIQGVLGGPIFRRYWPEHVNAKESARSRWTTEELAIDHPDRVTMMVRDPTVFILSSTSSKVGKHCDVNVLDDLVTIDNSQTEEGRAKINQLASQLSSILNSGGITLVVGTHYHPQDLYSSMVEQVVPTFDEDGNEVGERKAYEVFKRAVEEDGVFAWPRMVDPNDPKKREGFDVRVLATKRSEYLSRGEKLQFFCQYYLDPNFKTEDDSSTQFQYYDPRKLKNHSFGLWSYAGKKLNLYFGGDMAYSQSVQADYTAYAVIGVDSDDRRYILDLVQFKTEKYSEYYKEFVNLWRKWGFKKGRFETVGAAKVILNKLKEEVVKEGVSCALEGYDKKKDKAERFRVAVQPHYDKGEVLHGRFGYVTMYENQVTQARPKNDDLKDSVTTAFEIAVKPSANANGVYATAEMKRKMGNTYQPDTRFGGRRRKQ